MNDNFIFKNKNIINPLIKQLREYGLNHNIPIVSDEGLAYLLLLIKLKQVKHVLEIGCAIGYSSIAMAINNPDIIIDTIERDEKMIEKAKENIKLYNLDKQIILHEGDALDLSIDEFYHSYDLIFIDAAKAQYTNFFKKYEKCLKINGIIVTDNLLFHGLTNQIENIKSKNLRAMVRKINDYTSFLEENDKYDTTFLSIGDGMAVSIKKE